MANTFKNFFSKDVSSNTVVYTTAAATQTTVIGMTIANVLTSPVTANISSTLAVLIFLCLKRQRFQPVVLLYQSVVNKTCA